MAVTVIGGNIFTSSCQTLVNTINCVGVMGAGLALECRLRYPEMYDRYIDLCERSQIQIGNLWLYKAPERWVLNFPTKRHWKHPSRVDYLEAGLRKFLDTHQSRGIQSVAFPLLGADKGGLDPEFSLSLMERYLQHVEIPVEIYRYDPAAHDDLFEVTKRKLLAQDPSAISEATGIRPQYTRRVLEALESPVISQLNQLARVEGIGIKTLEKLFIFAKSCETQGSAGPMRQENLL